MDYQGALQVCVFALLFVAVIAGVCSMFIWLFMQYRKAKKGVGARAALPSKIWYCMNCWHYEFARTTRPCPKCQKRSVQGECWVAVKDMVRGLPSNVEYYKTMQRILLTESEN